MADKLSTIIIIPFAHSTTPHSHLPCMPHPNKMVKIELRSFIKGPPTGYVTLPFIAGRADADLATLS